MSEYVQAWVTLVQSYNGAAIALFSLSTFVLLVNVGKSLLSGR